MRIEIEHEGQTVIIKNDREGLSIAEMLQIFEQALKASGYVFDGNLEMTEEDDG